MRKTGLFLASIALSATLWAELPEKKGLDVINRANAEAYIGFLASDALEGREAGFRGGRIAGEYIVSNLKTMGIERSCRSGIRDSTRMKKRDCTTTGSGTMILILGTI